MEFPLMMLSSLMAFAVAGCATPGAPGTWKCEARNLMNGYYDGSDYAYIRLAPYPSGNRYKVQLNDQESEVRGTTGDGTPFVCTKL